MRQAFSVDQHINNQSGNKMNFGDEQRGNQLGEHAFRNIQQAQRREREMAFALMNQQGPSGPQALPSAAPSQNSSGLPTSIFDLYSSQNNALQDNSSSFLSSSLLQQNNGLDNNLANQNQLLYSDALNRMMPSSGATGGGGAGSGGMGAGASGLGQGAGGLGGMSSGQGAGGLGMSNGPGAGGLGMSNGQGGLGMSNGQGGLGMSNGQGGLGMSNGPLAGGMGAGAGGLGMSYGENNNNPYGLGLSDHPSLALSGGVTGLTRGLPSPAGPTGASMGGGNLDTISTAFLRDNALMRERLLAREGFSRGGDLQIPSQSCPQSYGSLLGGGARDWSTRSLQQQMMAGQQLLADTPSPNPLMGGFMGGSMSQHQQGGMCDPPESGKFPTCLPVTLAVPEDNQKLSSHQVLLRNQIEAFKASEDDLTTHTRGRNKPIKLGQVGIRCKHCARLPVARRQKGSTYFPASLHGLYQAAQNMNTTHMQSGLCTEMPPEYKQMFSEAMTNKVSSSVAGRPYWAKTAKQLGLINTEDGVRFIRDLSPNQIAQIKASQQQQQQQTRSGVNKGIPARLLS